MDANALIASAVAALQRGDRAAVSARITELLVLAPPLGDRWHAVAKIAAAIGAVSASVSAMQRYVDADPSDPARHFANAALQAECGRIEAARAAASKLVASHPGEPSYHHLLGTILAQLGDTDAARSHFRATLASAPYSGVTWLSLASLGALKSSDEDFRRILAAQQWMRNAPPESKAAYHYGLGKAYDDVEEYRLALLSFQQGAELVRATRAYDADLDKRLAVESLQEAYGTNRADGAAPNRAIFVVGLPRSGTTLVEQILTSHSQVADGGEINLFTRALGNGQSETKAGETAALYHHLLDERFGPDGLIVDKTLSHTRLIARIRSALPDAPIIWLRRDPLATAWSCFRTFFNQGLAWSWSPSDIASHFAAEELLFRHWQAAAGEKLLTLSYEELVLEPSRWIPAMLRHCGLGEEEGVYSFHQTRRAVTTSSVAQVRQPLHSGALRVPVHYRGFLEGFRTEFYRLTKSGPIPPTE